MARKSYAELKAIHAKNSQHIKEAEAEARARTGNGTVLTQNVQRASKKNGGRRRKGKRKFNENSGLLWGDNFDAFESSESEKKKDKDTGIVPEF